VPEAVKILEDEEAQKLIDMENVTKQRWKELNNQV